jgi:hypothetical protein
MTGPEGDRSWGTSRVTAVDPPTSLEFTDAFADTLGTPIADLPVSKVRVRLTERGDGTRMEMHSTFESREDMVKWVSLGTVEGLQQAVGQMDALLLSNTIAALRPAKPNRGDSTHKPGEPFRFEQNAASRRRDFERANRHGTVGSGDPGPFGGG